MQQGNYTPGGGLHIGLVVNDLWLTEHETPIASIRKGGSEGLMGRLSVGPQAQARRKPLPPRDPLPFDVFALALGLYQSSSHHRSKARRDAIDLRERYGLTAH